MITPYAQELPQETPQELPLIPQDLTQELPLTSQELPPEIPQPLRQEASKALRLRLRLRLRELPPGQVKRMLIAHVRHCRKLLAKERLIGLSWSVCRVRLE